MSLGQSFGLTKAIMEEKMVKGRTKNFQFVDFTKDTGKKKETRATGSVFGKSLCKRDFRQIGTGDV